MTLQVTAQKKIKQLLIVGVVILCSSISDNPIRPGNEILNTNRIPLGEDTFIIFTLEKDSLKPESVLQLQTDQQGNSDLPILIRAERMFNLAGSLIQLDSFSLEKHSLRPLYQRFVDARHDEVLDLTQFTKPAFYDNSMDMILASLPMNVGFKTQVALLGSSKDNEKIASVHVVEQTLLKTINGECMTWRLEVNAKGNGGTYWLSEPGRFLVRYVSAEHDMVIVRMEGCPMDI